MEFIEKITYIFVGLVIGLIIGLFVFRPGLPVGVAEYNRFSDANITIVSVATSTATEVLVAKGGRLYTRIDNPDGTNPVYCVFGETSDAADGKGIKIEAGESYEIRPNNLYTGKISCIATGADVTISIIEK